MLAVLTDQAALVVICAWYEFGASVGGSIHLNLMIARVVSLYCTLHPDYELDRP